MGFLKGQRNLCNNKVSVYIKWESVKFHWIVQIKDFFFLGYLVFLDTSCAHPHSLSQVPHCANSHPDDPGGAINHACEEMLSRTSRYCVK